MSYHRKAGVFADGAEGYALQIYCVYDGETKTDIEEVAERKDGKWTTVIRRGDEQYSTMPEAIAAYEKTKK